MKTNVTLTLDADLLREARILAAEEGTSISAMLADHVEALYSEDLSDGQRYGDVRVVNPLNR